MEAFKTPVLNLTSLQTKPAAQILLTNEEFQLACKKRIDINFMCKLAVNCKQWPDLSQAVQKIIALLRTKFSGADLTFEEKNYFNCAFKNLIQMKRKQWRTLYETFNKEEEVDPSEETNFKLKCIKKIIRKVESEIRQLCKQIFIESRYFLKHSKSAESKVFY